MTWIVWTLFAIIVELKTWLSKKLANSTLANPLFGTCCHEGKIIFPLLQQQPHILQQMFDENYVMAKEF